MHRVHQQLLAALCLVSVVLTTAACTSPAPTPTPHPRPTSTVDTAPTVHRFASTVYDFRVTLPPGWKGVDAKVSWDGEQLQGGDSPAFVNVTESGNHRELIIGAAPVVMGTTLAAWRAALIRGHYSSCVDARSASKVSFGGEAALTWTTRCPDADTVTFAVVRGGRGYVGILVSDGARMTLRIGRPSNRYAVPTGSRER